MMTQSWARDLGDRQITSNVIQPGPIDTDMNPADGAFGETLTAMTAIKRYGKPEEIAELAAFLASPAEQIPSRSLYINSRHFFASSSVVDTDSKLRHKKPNRSTSFFMRSL